MSKVAVGVVRGGCGKCEMHNRHTSLRTEANWSIALASADVVWSRIVERWSSSVFVAIDRSESSRTCRLLVATVTSEAPAKRDTLETSTCVRSCRLWVAFVRHVEGTL